MENLYPITVTILNPMTLCIWQVGFFIFHKCTYTENFHTTCAWYYHCLYLAVNEVDCDEYSLDGLDDLPNETDFIKAEVDKIANSDDDVRSGPLKEAFEDLMGEQVSDPHHIF